METITPTSQLQAILRFTRVTMIKLWLRMQFKVTHSIFSYSLKSEVLTEVRSEL